MSLTPLLKRRRCILQPHPTCSKGTRWRSLKPLQKCSRSILQPQPNERIYKRKREGKFRHNIECRGYDNYTKELLFKPKSRNESYKFLIICLSNALYLDRTQFSLQIRLKSVTQLRFNLSVFEQWTGTHLVNQAWRPFFEFH